MVLFGTCGSEELELEFAMEQNRHVLRFVCSEYEIMRKLKRKMRSRARR